MPLAYDQGLNKSKAVMRGYVCGPHGNAARTPKLLFPPIQ